MRLGARLIIDPAAAAVALGTMQVGEAQLALPGSAQNPVVEQYVRR